MFHNDSKLAQIALVVSLIMATTFGVSLISTRAANSQSSAEFWQSEGWKTNFALTSIDFLEVMSGGPPKDGIPSIDKPEFIEASDEFKVKDVEPVIGLSINGDARAYPLRILMWHEIVNDVVGGEPLAVTFCPLCNAAITFERTVDGKVLEFGTTGKLRKSDLVMYDRTTESWWQQFSGEAIVGDLLGTKLKLVASRLESFGQFKARFPAGKVLKPDPNVLRSYGQNPYVGYDSRRAPYFDVGGLPTDINPMERVVVVRNEGKDPTIITMNAAREKGALKRNGYQISWKAGQTSALDDRVIASSRDVGSIVVTRDGKDVPYDVTFAFVAHSFHPEVAIARK